MNQQINRIQNNHAKIISCSTEQLRRVFGAGKHRFQFNPVATTAQVDAYEQKYQFAFPESYKKFILEIGDGGAGPFYGIQKRFTSFGSTLRDEEAKTYRLPSIYTADCPPGDYWQALLLGPDYEQLEDENDALYMQGNMTLFEVGCGTQGVLVLNGPRKNQVCITDFGSSPYQFCIPPDFLDLYESWQEAVLRGTSAGQAFGFGF